MHLCPCVFTRYALKIHAFLLCGDFLIRTHREIWLKFTPYRRALPYANFITEIFQKFHKYLPYTNLGSCISIVQFFGKNRQKQALIFSPISFCVVPYFFLGFGLAEKFPYHLQFYWIFYRWLVNSMLEALWSEIGDSIWKLYHNQRPVLYPSWSSYILRRPQNFAKSCGLIKIYELYHGP